MRWLWKCSSTSLRLCCPLSTRQPSLMVWWGLEVCSPRRILPYRNINNIRRRKFFQVIKQIRSLSKRKAGARKEKYGSREKQEMQLWTERIIWCHFGTRMPFLSSAKTVLAQWTHVCLVQTGSDTCPAYGSKGHVIYCFSALSAALIFLVFSGNIPCPLKWRDLLAVCSRAGS